MARFLRMSDDDVERLFRGLASGEVEDLGDLASFLAEARESLSRPPRNEVEARHLAVLAEAIRSPAGEAQASRLPITTSVRAPAARAAERRGPMRHRTVRWAAKVAVTAASLVLLTGGLAFAGVDLPGTAAETAFQKVGVSLPNQEQEEAAEAVDPAKLPPEASETAARVLAVIHEWYSGEPWIGCEFGARVSHAARGLEGEPDTSHCDAARSNGEDVDEGSDADDGNGAAGNAEEGLKKADEASGGAASQGAANGQAGLEVAGQASGGAAGGAEDGESDDLEEPEDEEGPDGPGAEAAEAGRDRAP